MRGFSTLEILIALAVAALFLTSASMLAFGGQSAGLDVALTQGGLSTAAAQIDDASASTSADWGSSATPWGTSWYGRSNAITNISPCLKLVQSDTTWTSVQSRGFEEGLQTLVGNIIAAKALGGCDPFPPSDWDTPEIAGGEDISQGQGTGVAASYINGTRYAFFTTVHSTQSTEDFWVVDTSDPANPNLLVAAATNFSMGLNDIAIAGSYAFLANASSTASESSDELLIVDISTPAAPSQLARLSLGITPNCPQFCPGGAQAIYYYNDRLYLGTHRIGGNEFFIVDVSNPLAPTILGSFGLNHNINDITVSGNYAYLATSDDVGELTILNISNPASISVIGRYDAVREGGGQASDEDGLSVFVLGNYAFLGRERTNNANERDFYVLDVSVPSAPSKLDAERYVSTGSGGVNAIHVQGNLVFLGTSDSNDEFKILNISNPTDIQVQPTCGPSLNYPQVAGDIDYIDNLVFVANRSNEVFRIMYDTPNVCS
jgi:hypothetical protein